MKITSNILIIGKSGVGKSSFLNYIYGGQVAKVGTGKPVTSYGLDEYVYQDSNITHHIYDSWGLEANKAKEFEELIMNQIDKRDHSLTIKEWFHTIYYCFSASTARVEDFEVKHIIKPLIRKGNNVTIIFTHADVPNALEKIEGMKRVLLEDVGNELTFINVCSERKQLLSGKVVEPFGKEEVLQHIKENLWSNIKNKLPQNFNMYLIREVKKLHERNLLNVSYFKIRGEIKTIEQLNHQIEVNTKEFIASIYDKINNDLYEAMYYYFELIGQLLPFDKDITERMLAQLEADLEKRQLEPREDGFLLEFVQRNVVLEAAAKTILSPLVKRKLRKQIDKQTEMLKEEMLPRVKEYYQYRLDNIEQHYSYLT